MAEHDLHIIGTATFEEVSMLPRNILLRNETVTLGDIRYTSKIKSNLFLECTTAGTTASTAVSFANVSEGATVTDGTVVWTVKKVGSGSGGYFATCSTAAGTAAKTVSITGFRLEAGASIRVKFANANTAANPTLNVSGTGAKAIRHNGAAIPAAALLANSIYEFVYADTYWYLLGGSVATSATTATAQRGVISSVGGYNDNFTSDDGTNWLSICRTTRGDGYTSAWIGIRHGSKSGGILLTNTNGNIETTLSGTTIGTFKGDLTGNAATATTAKNIPTSSGQGNIWIE